MVWAFFTLTPILTDFEGFSITNTQPNLINALTPFQNWQENYFNCTDCTDAAMSAEPDGDGQDNLAEYLAGTDPTSSESALRSISLSRQSNEVLIGWTTAGVVTPTQFRPLRATRWAATSPTSLTSAGQLFCLDLAISPPIIWMWVALRIILPAINVCEWCRSTTPYVSCCPGSGDCAAQDYSPPTLAQAVIEEVEGENAADAEPREGDVNGTLLVAQLGT